MYRFRVFTKQDVAANGNGVSFRLAFYDSGGGLSQRVTSSRWMNPGATAWSLDSGWVMYEGIATAPDDAVSVKLEISANQLDGYAFFDDVTFHEFDPGDTIYRSTYSLAGQPIATRVETNPSAGPNDGLYYIHTDHLGSVSAMTDDSGSLEGSIIRFDPFGDYRPGSGAGDITDRGFTGHKHNDYIKMIYMGARWYLPGVGRFISADSIVPNPANPQSYNRFSYVQNNPIKLVDPTGHGEECPVDVEDCGLPAPQDSSPPNPILPPALPPMVDFDSFVCNDETTCAYQEQVIAAIWEAAYLVGDAFAKVLNSEFGWDLSPEEAFLLVYGGTVVFKWTGEDNPEGAAFTEGPNSILIYNTKVTNKTEWIIHELGHAFSQKLGGKPVMDTDSFLSGRPSVGRPRDVELDPDLFYGFAGSFDSPRKWQQTAVTTPSEQFADMFLGWVYGKWEPGSFANTNYSYAGFSMSNFMNTYMPHWLDLIVQN